METRLKFQKNSSLMDHLFILHVRSGLKSEKATQRVRIGLKDHSFIDVSLKPDYSAFFK